MLRPSKNIHFVTLSLYHAHCHTVLFEKMKHLLRTLKSNAYKIPKKEKYQQEIQFSSLVLLEPSLIVHYTVILHIMHL